MIEGVLAGMCLFLVGLLAVALTNQIALQRLGSLPPPTGLPSVSVLVPARNEEEGIAACLITLLAQDYPRLEILALDDESTDRTAQVLASLAAVNRRLQVHSGLPLPPGWLGKNWACAQLAGHAQGELLLFTDADTRHAPAAVREAVAALQQSEADLLAAWPRLLAVSWGERLLVPLIAWSVFAILPIPLAHRVRLPALSAGIGQFLLFRRAAYQAVGGHTAVRQHAAEDLALCRRAKRAGLRWRLMDAQALVQTRMYGGLRQAWAGLGKNLYPAFGYRALPLVLAWTWLALVAWAPLIALGYRLAGGTLSLPATTLATAAIALWLVVWGLVVWRTGYPLRLAGLYPVLLLTGLLVALYSVVLTRAGQATWKARRLDRPGGGVAAARPAEGPR